MNLLQTLRKTVIEKNSLKLIIYKSFRDSFVFKMYLPNVKKHKTILLNTLTSYIIANLYQTINPYRIKILG